MAAEIRRPGGERKFVDLSLETVEADGVFTGYASLFGKVDLGKDVVERGAFARSIEARGAGGIRMLFQHDPNEPIGTWTEVREDARGLFVRGRLSKDVARAREILGLMRVGALDGLSIGFKTVRARNDAAAGVRRIVEADLWEISVVTFPMLPGARIETVRGYRPKAVAVAGVVRWLRRKSAELRRDKNLHAARKRAGTGMSNQKRK